MKIKVERGFKTIFDARLFMHNHKLIKGKYYEHDRT